MADFPSGYASKPGKPDETQLRQALTAYQQVIDLVRQGTADPDQLALSSLGQQARIHLWLGEIVPAVHLYAQQAAQGDPIGSLSLQYVSSMLVNPENIELLKNNLTDPLVQQLVTIELFSRSANLRWHTGQSEEAVQPVIDHVLTLLNSKVKHNFPGSDQLAALAYRSGRYTMTETLLQHAGDSGLAWWLRAKMALRGGDIRAATTAYAKAAAAFPATETWQNLEQWPTTIMPACRIAGEQAILALQRGDYLQALELLYRGKDDYWDDIADVAERVLTINELKSFVAQHAPATSLPPAINTTDDLPLTLEAKLRELLARRLMRAERYQEAMPYFVSPQTHELAQQYTKQLNLAADQSASKRLRAEAYYQAAQLLRNHGMDLVGYEMAPDFATLSGLYSYLGDAFPPGEERWLSPLVATRTRATLPKKQNRFLHYRWQAVDLALKAASLVPPKSLTYAAVMCRAASWVIKRDAKTGHQLYLRYLKHGMRYDWTPKFGYDCPEPDFSVH